MLTAQTRYAKSGDVHIAYQVVGEGPPDVVVVNGWVLSLELYWDDPGWSSFFRRLASFSRLIIFDKRGTGLSDRVSVREMPTLEERMDDVRAVMDAVGSNRAFVFGISEGGPMSMLFAATYPERAWGDGTFSGSLLAPSELPGRLPYFVRMEREGASPGAMIALVRMLVE